MPETGLEPALPLQEPGPQPGASANSATPACFAFAFAFTRSLGLPADLQCHPDSLEHVDGTYPAPAQKIVTILDACDLFYAEGSPFAKVRLRGFNGKSSWIIRITPTSREGDARLAQAARRFHFGLREPGS